MEASSEGNIQVDSRRMNRNCPVEAKDKGHTRQRAQESSREHHGTAGSYLEFSIAGA